MCPPLPSTFPEDRLCAWPAAWPDLHAGPESSDWLAGSLVPVGSDLPEPGPEALRRLSPPETAVPSRPNGADTLRSPSPWSLGLAECLLSFFLVGSGFCNSQKLLLPPK